MSKFEYKHQIYHFTRKFASDRDYSGEIFEDILNEYGSDGWDIISIATTISLGAVSWTDGGKEFGYTELVAKRVLEA